MRVIILILVLLSGHFLSAQYELKPMKGDYYVIARSGLNMRESADKSAKKIKKIPYSAKVKVMEVNDEVVTVGWLRGYWALVKYNEKRGYVFSVYLNKLQPPQTFEPDTDCEFLAEMGFERLLSKYAKKLKAVDSPQVLYELERTEYDEDKMKITRQNLEQNAQLIEEWYYESGVTILRFTGDIFQAYALLEAIGYPCENLRDKIKNCRVVRSRYEEPIQVEDKEQGGWIFEIKKLDATTVQISMGSGV